MRHVIACLALLAALAGAILPVGAAALGADGAPLPLVGPVPAIRPEASAAPDALQGDAGYREIFSNLGSDPLPLYECCYAWGISGPAAERGEATSLGVSFRPLQNARVRKLQLGLSYLSGTNAVSVSLHEDTAGVPGQVLATFPITELQAMGRCCGLVRMSPRWVAVRGGRLYWVTVRAASDTFAGWNLGLPFLVGPLALDRGSGWGPYSGLQPSLRVLGL